MLRIGICDDMQDARFALRCALERALEQRNMEAEFFEFSAGEWLLRWMENHAGELDLVFLDLEMGELDGIATARKLRAADDGLQIVFVTAYADRVFDGYTVGALGYLMKPPQPGQLDDILTRAAAALYKDAEKTFICRSGDVTYRIPVTPFFPVLLQFWESDEEFPPQLQLMWDRNADSFLHFETTFFLQGDLLERLKKAMAI